MEAKVNLLLIEDDDRIIEFVQPGLQAEGYDVKVIKDGQEAKEFIPYNQYEAIILDLLLPGVDGRVLCAHIRSIGIRVPILMLTALDSVEDRVLGLKLGADDYLTKPFAFEELLARISALLRRSGEYQKQSSQSILKYADLLLNEETFEVSRADKAIDLTPREFTLLAHLVRHSGKVVSKLNILENVWGYDKDPLTNVVEVYIRHLRQKIDSPESSSLIQTVRGFGYKLSESELK